MRHNENSGTMNGSGNGSYVDQDIAIIGMSCKAPGESTSPEKLWELCVRGRNAWSKIPSERFSQAAFYHPQGEHPGRVGYMHPRPEISTTYLKLTSPNSPTCLEHIFWMKTSHSSMPRSLASRQRLPVYESPLPLLEPS